VPQFNPHLLAAKGEDTADLLSHIAWTEVILPALQQAKMDLATQLAASHVGANRSNLNAPTTEELAAKIYGIDFITRLFERILAQGQQALKYIYSNSNLS